MCLWHSRAYPCSYYSKDWVLDRSKWTDSHCPLVSKFSRSTTLFPPCLCLSVFCIFTPSPHLSFIYPLFSSSFFLFSIFIFLNFPFSIILSGCTVSNWTIMFCQSLKITSGPAEVQTDGQTDRQTERRTNKKERRDIDCVFLHPVSHLGLLLLFSGRTGN